MAGWTSSDVVKSDLGPLLQDQMRVSKLKSAYNTFYFYLIILNIINFGRHLQKYASCPFLVDTSCIWSQMRPWSSCLLYLSWGTLLYFTYYTLHYSHF